MQSLQSDFAAGVYLSEAPPFHAVYVYTCILIHTGRGVGEVGDETREKVRGATVHKAGSKIPT